MKDYFDFIKRIEVITKSPFYELIESKKLLSSVSPIIENNHKIRELTKPAISALLEAANPRNSGIYQISEAFSPVFKELTSLSEIIKKVDYSSLLVPDSVTSKLTELLDSVEEDVPEIKEEILQSTEIEVDSVVLPKKKLNLEQIVLILNLILPVLAMIQAQYNAEQSSIQDEKHHQEQIEQSERHHLERIEQSERHHRENNELIKSIITDLRSYLDSEDINDSADQ